MLATERIKTRPAARTLDESAEKPYERQVGLNTAGLVAHFLVHRGVDFEARYAGQGRYAFTVERGGLAQSMLDDLLDKIIIEW
jgi:hypothetical protein